MADFSMEIADVTGAVTSLFDSTKDYCRDYLSEKVPEFHIAVKREDLAFEQQELDEEAAQEGMRRRVFSDPFLERAAIQRAFAEHLIERDVLMMHGSTVSVDGKGYLFTAKCGTGKSTHTRFWREVFGSRVVMVNDDKPFVAVTPEKILVCGAPWSGKHGLHSNISVPLQGICILERGVENRIRRIGAEEARDMLLHQSYCPAEPEKQEVFQNCMEEVLRRVPLWKMECTKDPQAAQVAWDAMHAEAKEPGL